MQLGITFKENCPDIRNSRAVDVVCGLKEFGCNVDIFDPWADPQEVEKEYGISTFDSLSQLSKKYDAIVLAVAHKEFLTLDIGDLKSEHTAVFDIKGILPREMIDARL